MNAVNWVIICLVAIAVVACVSLGTKYVIEKIIDDGFDFDEDDMDIPPPQNCSDKMA